MNQSGRRSAAVAALLAPTLLGIGASPTVLADDPASFNPPIIVDTTDDLHDEDFSDGLCHTAADTCSLRAAISTANQRLGPDSIHFDIPGQGTHRIEVAGQLPTLTDRTGPVTIDGYTQHGATPNTASSGSNAQIRVEVFVPETEVMLRIISPANHIRGLAVFGARIHFLIDNENADGNRIEGNFIGTDAAGFFESPKQNGTSSDVGVGLLIESGSDRNEIGAPTSAGRNVIAGNGGSGIRINHSATSGNRVQNNVVGLNPALTDSLNQARGIDLQFSTSQNLIGGELPFEGNLVGGHRAQTGIELSHGAHHNLVVGNLVGTLGDGNSTAGFTRNSRGIALKDGVLYNYLADDVVGGNTIGIWHKHNYTGENTFVANRVGVGLNGGAIANMESNVSLTGHDQVWHGNLFANQAEQIRVSNFRNGKDDFYFKTYTHANRIQQSQFHNSGADANRPYIDIVGDPVQSVHDGMDRPVLTGRGPGKVFGTTCAGCTVEVYVSGVVQSDGSMVTSGTEPGTGLAWIGTVNADANGEFGMADGRIVSGRTVSALAIDQTGNTSELPVGLEVPGVHVGTDGDGEPSIGGAPEPARPPRPDRYSEPTPFVCRHQQGTLTWTARDTARYTVSATVDGVVSEVGTYTATSINVAPADLYTVRALVDGSPVEVSCDGAGLPDPDGGGGGSGGGGGGGGGGRRHRRRDRAVRECERLPADGATPVGPKRRLTAANSGRYAAVESAANCRTSSSGKPPSQPVIGVPSAAKRIADGCEAMFSACQLRNDSSHSIVNDSVP